MIRRPGGRSYHRCRVQLWLMLVRWRSQTKMNKRVFVVVTIGLAGLWLLARYWRSDHVDIGQSLSLRVDDNNIQLRLSSPDGTACLRGTLGGVDSGVLIAGSVKSCSVANSRHEGVCAEMKVPGSSRNKPVLRLEVAYAGNADCYTVKWRARRLTPASSKDVSVVDCYTLDGALWYGGGQVLDQRWPINFQRSVMQPHVTSDYLLPQWRSDPAYGKYGSLAEPYWLSSGGVGIVVDDHIAISSSFNAGGDGRLCLKGDRTTNVKTDSGYLAEILSYTVCRGEDVAAVHRTMSGLFFAHPTGYPDVRMMRKPVWSTWALYRSKVDQRMVEEMAERILHYKFPHSQLEIDDRYSTTYGQFDFDVKKFPNASHMIHSLRDRGFRVTCWITPFSNLDCPVTDEGKAKRFWLTDSRLQMDTHSALTRWWRGKGVVLDVTNSAAVTWFTERLRQFSVQFGVDSFKFDAGEVGYLPPHWRTAVPLSNPNRYTTLYVNMAATFGRMIEVRAAFRNQQLPVFVRMLDKDSAWGQSNGLRSLIPTALAYSIAGYPFVLPDMIGGNGVPGKPHAVPPDRELFVRWAELTAFMPAMQFSFAPWQYDDETVAIVRKFVHLHETAVGDELERAANDAVLHGWPIIRPLWWLAPTDDVALRCDSQFLLGDRLLVAPVLDQGARSRDIYLPGGPSIRWKDYFASESNIAEVLPGGTWIRNKSVELDQIAVFMHVE